MIQKLRELEIQLQDFRSQTDRRFTQVFEEVPTSLDREVKRLEARGFDSLRQTGAQHSLVSEQLAMAREFFMVQLEQINERTATLKAKVDEHELKVGTLVRNQDYLKVALSQIPMHKTPSPSLLPPGPSPSSSLGAIEMESEVRALRGQMMDERARREQMNVEQQQLIA